MLRAILTVLIAWGCGSSRPSERAALADERITVVGPNYCMACALTRRAGVTSKCDFYGHQHALKVESALDPHGRSIDDLVGETLHYLDNDESAALVDFDDYHDKRVRVEGRLFVREHVIAVETVDAL